jgi:hypothetical protein
MKEWSNLEWFLNINRHFLTPVVISIGLVTNLLILIVMLNEEALLRFQKGVKLITNMKECDSIRRLIVKHSSFFKHRQTRLFASISLTNSLLFALAFSDIFNNIIPLIAWLTDLNLVDFLAIDFNCQLFSYLKYICRFLSAMFTLMYTIQRFVAVWSPLDNRNRAYKFKPTYVITILILFALVIYSFSFRCFDSKSKVNENTGVLFFDEDKPRCGPSRTSVDLVYMIDNTIDLLLTVIIPIVGIISLNTIVCLKIVYSDKRRMQIGKSHSVKIKQSLEYCVRRKDSNLFNLESLQISMQNFTEFNIQKVSKMTFEQFRKRFNASLRLIVYSAEIKCQKEKLSRIVVSSRVTMTIMIVSLTFIVLNLKAWLC